MDPYELPDDGEEPVAFLAPQIALGEKTLRRNPAVFTGHITRAV